MRCGVICKACGGSCVDPPTEQLPAEIECPNCNGRGCEYCQHGHFQLTECPQRYAAGMAEAINMASMCGNGAWPVAGGLLDQAAWFTDLWCRLRSEESRIDAERYSGR